MFTQNNKNVRNKAIKANQIDDKSEILKMII